MDLTQRIINSIFFGKILVLGIFLPVFLLQDLYKGLAFSNSQILVLGVLTLFFAGVGYGFKNNEKITYIPQKYFMVMFLPVLLLLAIKLYQIIT